MGAEGDGPKKWFLTEADRAELVRVKRKVDSGIADLQKEARGKIDAILDKYDLPYPANDFDLTTGEILPPPSAPTGARPPHRPAIPLHELPPPAHAPAPKPAPEKAPDAPG